MASAIATLLDFGWKMPSIGEWLALDDIRWSIDFKATNILPMLREVLQFYFQQHLWEKAAIFPDGAMPDLSDGIALRRAGLKANSFQKVYWLEAITQGSMETSLQHLAIKQDGYIKCS